MNRKEYYRKLRQWEAEGYDVSELREKWFHGKRTRKSQGLSRRAALSMGLGAFLLFIFIFIFCFVPLQTVPYAVTEKYQITETYYVSEPYTVQEPYIETETYYEKEPFTRTETYTESEPYSKSVPIDYIVTSKAEYRYFWNTGFEVWVNIKNADLKSGTFTIRFTCIVKDGAGHLYTNASSVSKYIAIGDTEKIQYNYNPPGATIAILNSWTYSVTEIPSKTVTEYRDVQKTSEVVEYRDVAKTREVTKYQTVTKYKDVTKYRDVPKERTVWKERPATLFKKVTLLEKFLNY